MDDIEDHAKYIRIPIIDKSRCKPKKCNQECKKKCPPNLTGKMCIDVAKTSAIVSIAENLCIGCGQCEKVCPFNAIKMVKIPTNLRKDIVYRYGPNLFKLHRLPVPKKGKILGLVGSNGLGKSTIIDILNGKNRINFGKFNVEISDKEIKKYFNGTELFDFFNSKKSVAVKPQYPRDVSNMRDTVAHFINSEMLTSFDLLHIKERELCQLSGGELQRVMCAKTIQSNCDVLLFDEPTSFLDIKQRIKIADLIKSVSRHDNYIVIVEHDLSILDYLSDSISVLYGEPGAFGVVSKQCSVAPGINIFLNGYIPSENIRFREEPFTFYINKQESEDVKIINTFNYPSLTTKICNFTLNITSGEFRNSMITVLLGENGVGKTTFIKMLKDNLEFTVSYKPQNIKHDLENNNTVYDELQNAIGDQDFVGDVIKPLGVDKLYTKRVKYLSGGELQKLYITKCLYTKAQIYMLDEPSAYLDSSSRIACAKILKRYFAKHDKSAFVIEHDMLMITYLADQIILFDGKPGINTTALAPCDLTTGMNRFLQSINVTFRKDVSNNRPRINKQGSVKDTEQKLSGNYYIQ